MCVHSLYLVCPWDEEVEVRRRCGGVEEEEAKEGKEILDGVLLYFVLLTDTDERAEP